MSGKGHLVRQEMIPHFVAEMEQQVDGGSGTFSTLLKLNKGSHKIAIHLTTLYCLGQYAKQTQHPD